MSRPRDPHSDDVSLEQQLERTWDDPTTTGARRAAGEVIGPALATFRSQRRRRLIGASTACLLLLGVGWWAFARPSEQAPRLETADAVAYAEELFRRVMHDPARADDDDFEVLSRDADARQEYLAALDHPSSHVRRTALYVLAFTSVEVPAPTLTRLLVEHREDLERPLQVASVGDAGRLIAEAIERRRLATLQSVLAASATRAAQGHAVIEAKALEPFLQHENESVRLDAVRTLGYLEGYQPSAAIRRLMRDDPSFQVRVWAIRAIQNRLGEAGGRELLAHLATLDDPAIEKVLAPSLTKVEGFEAIARAKFEATTNDLDLHLAYAKALHDAGHADAARTVLPRAIREGEGDALRVAAFLAAKMDAKELRTSLIVQLPRVEESVRSSVTATVVIWDLDKGDKARALESLALIEAHGRRSDVRHLRPHLEHGDPAVRAAVVRAINSLEGP